MFRYIGTKAKTAPYIADIILDYTRTGSVVDAFGGMGIIGSTLKQHGFHVTTCDVLSSPNAFQVARIRCNAIPAFRPLLKRLNLISVDELASWLNERTQSDSWIVTEYSDKRLFFTRSNAEHIAGVWNDICEWNEAGILSENEKAYLMASLLNSMDAVANTAGTYYAHLKSFYRKALRPFNFAWIPPVLGKHQGDVMQGDALDCLAGKKFDVLYLDPPYNGRNYAKYYHLPESLASLKEPKINSKSACGMPIESDPRSPSIHQGKTLNFVEKLITSVEWKLLIFHYADGAYIPLPTLKEMLNEHGDVAVHEISTLGYSTKKESRKSTHHVFTITR